MREGGSDLLPLLRVAPDLTLAHGWEGIGFMGLQKEVKWFCFDGPELFWEDVTDKVKTFRKRLTKRLVTLQSSMCHIVVTVNDEIHLGRKKEQEQ